MNSSAGARRTYRGLTAARGTVAGPVYIYRGDGDTPIPEYIVAPGREQDELLRLKRALVDARRDLEGLIAVLKERTGRQDVRIFECHLMILEDSALLDETEGYIRDGRLNAEAAVRKTATGARRQFERMNDPYFRERVRDLDDVERRLIKALTGCERRPALELSEPSIVVAGDLTPSETVQLPPPDLVPMRLTIWDSFRAAGTRLPQEKLTGEIRQKTFLSRMLSSASNLRSRFTSAR